MDARPQNEGPEEKVSNGKPLSSDESGQNPRSSVGGRALLPNEVHLIPVPIVHSELGMST